jgi:hypothetical protein
VETSSPVPVHNGAGLFLLHNITVLIKIKNSKIKKVAAVAVGKSILSMTVVRS